MPLISIITSCLNEEGNIHLLHKRVDAVFSRLEGYDYEHIFADNGSTDQTLNVLKELAAQERRIRIIVNMRNFGAERSVFNALLSAKGDAAVVLAADLQDPPELIAEFISKWEQGASIVFGVRARRRENFIMTAIRKLYYRLLKAAADFDLANDSGDFVLIDNKVVGILSGVKDHTPYLRGLLVYLGLPVSGVKYTMQERHAGKTTNNFYRLFLVALNGFVSSTMMPMRLATIVGISMSALSILIACIQATLKIMYWDSAPPGIPTIIIGMFLLFGIQFFLVGYLGEMIGTIHSQGRGIPRVIERERINFDADA